MVVSIKQSVIYYKSVYYAMLLVLFAILGYVFFDSGINTRTKVRVDYEDKSNVYYEIDYINDSYQSSGDRYVSNMVDNITFKLFSDCPSGSPPLNVRPLIYGLESIFLISTYVSTVKGLPAL